MGVESSLSEAGAAIVKVVGSVVQAQNAISDGVSFAAAIVDLRLRDGDASPLDTILSRRGIPVIVTTGDHPDDVQADLSNAVVILRKPYSESELIKAAACLAKANESANQKN